MLKKLFFGIIFLLFLLFVSATSIFAATVTISSTTIENIQYGGSTCTLKIWANSNFFTSGGLAVLGGAVGSDNVYKSVACTISGTTLTIPSLTIDSTTDSIDKPTAVYTAVFYDSTGRRRDVYLSNFRVSHSLAPTTTWGAIRLNNVSSVTELPTTYYTAAQVDALLNSTTFVKYDVVQSLTEQEQERARNNIGAIALALSADAYGAVGNGSTDDATILNTMVADAQTLGLPIMLGKSKTYRIDSSLDGSASNITFLCPDKTCSIKGGASGSGTILNGATSGYLFNGWTIDGVELKGFVDLRSTKNFTFVNSKLRMVANYVVQLSGTHNVRFLNTTIYGTQSGVMTAGSQEPSAVPSATYGSGVRVLEGTTDTLFSEYNCHFCLTGIGADSFDTKAINNITIEKSTFRGDWWNSPYVIKRFTPTAYNSSTKRLTYATGGLTGLFGGGQLHIISVPIQIASVGSFTSISNNAITATFGTTLQRGDSIETANGKRAEVLSVTSSTLVTISGWESIDTFEPTTAPSAATAFRVMRHYGSAGTFVSDTEVDLYNDPVNPFSGERLVTDAALTPVSVSVKVMSTLIYSGIHINGGGSNLIVKDSTFRGARADQISVFDTEAPQILGNKILYGNDEGVTLTRAHRAIVSGNKFEFAGVSAIFIGSNFVNFSGNTINTWGTVLRVNQGAVDIGGTYNSITGNTASVVAGGAGSGSTYFFGANNGGSFPVTGTVIDGNSDGGARTATLFIDATVGNLIGRDLLSVAGSGASNVNAVSSADNIKANSYTLKYDNFIEGKGLRFLDNSGANQAYLYSSSDVIFKSLNSSTGFGFFDSSNNYQLRMLNQGATGFDFGFGTASPIGRVHVLSRALGTRGLVVQSNSNTEFAPASVWTDGTNYGTIIQDNYFRVYNSSSTVYDSATASGVEYLQIKPISNIYQIESKTNGGTARPIQLMAGSVNLNIATTGIKFTLGSDATGDMWRRNASGFFERFGIGNPGECLVVNGSSLPDWDTCASGGSGLTSLNSQTGSTQTFANDTNVTISSSSDTHTLGWTGTLAVSRGGTGSANASDARTALGLTIGTNVQAFDADLSALAGISSNGLFARTGSGTASARTLTGTSNEISIADGDGVSGNPTFSLPSTIDLSGKTSLKIPTGTNPTVNASGIVAIDSNTDNSNITQGSIKYYDGTQAMYVVAVDTLPTTDTHVLTYDGTAKKYKFAASAGGGGAAGSNTQVTFNDGGTAAGDSGMVFDKTTNALTITGAFAMGADKGLYMDGAGSTARFAYWQSGAGTFLIGSGGQSNDFQFSSVSASYLLTIQGSSAKVAVNIAAGSGGGQLSVLSGSASLPAFRATSAASPTADLAQIYLDTTKQFWINKYGQIAIEEITSNPGTSDLTDGTGLAIYRKADRLVIAFNNAGTMTYLTIPLDGSTATWTQSTSAP